MSKNVRANVAMEVQARRLLGMATQSLSCTSSSLREAASSIEATGQLSPAALTLLGDAGVAELATQAGLADELEGLIAARDASALDPEPAGLLLDRLGSHRGRQERAAFTTAACDVLRVRGWHVVSESGENADGVEAWKGDDLMLLAVTDGPLQVLADQAGTGDCGMHQTEFEADMADRGFVLSTLAEDDHEPLSGPLIAKAASAGEASLASAIARRAVSSSSNRAKARRHGASGRGPSLVIGGTER